MNWTPSLSKARRMALAILVVVCVTGNVGARAAGSPDGIALAIVYDTSGSMLEQVRDGEGRMAPKFRIANRALETIVRRLETVAAGGAPGSRRPLECGLVVFNRDHASMAVKYGTFDAGALQTWVKGFSVPQGSTPLGEAMQMAGQALLASNLPRKHVLILTDGVNTRGADPAAVMPKLQQDANRKKTSISCHFVAFDVDAKVFARVKKLGATVVGAADEKQLNSQLQFILEEKILLEEEEPPSAKTKQQ